MADKEIDDMVKAYVDNMPDMVLNSNGIMNWRVFFNDVAKKVAGAAYKDGINAAQDELWKPADGDNLPEYEREVIVLHQPGTLKLEKTEYCVSFAHRPDPKGWDGKSLLTGKTEHYTPKTYGSGGWNIPDVKWWLDLDFPNES